MWVLALVIGTTNATGGDFNVEFPKNHRPTSLPTQAMDEHVRVALVLPEFRNTGWTEATGASVIAVTGDYTTPTSAALTSVISALFPRTHVETSAVDYEKYDFTLQVAVTPFVYSPAWKPPDFAGVEIKVVVTMLDSHGQKFAELRGTGRGDRNPWIILRKSQYAHAGVAAIKAMLENFLRDTLSSAPLLAFLREKAAARSRPCELETVVVFDDAGALFPNGRLDAGESAALRIKVRNVGAGPAFNAHVSVSSPRPEIMIAGDAEVGDLPPGAEKEVSIEVAAALGVPSAVLQLPVNTTEKRGYDGPPLAVEIRTEALRRPNLEIIDVSLADAAGRAVGDGDGLPANGETIEVVALVRNAGPGEAAGGVVTIAPQTAGVQVLDQPVPLRRIPPNGVQEARMLLRLPITLDASELAIKVAAVEVRGPEAAATEASHTWPVRSKRPALGVTYRLFDGNSASSRGDRDGVANNGENLELVLTPFNRGDLMAREVTLSIASRQEGVTLSRREIEIGDLPPRTEAPEQRLGFQIARTTGRDLPLDQLSFAVTLTQRDFAAKEEPVSVAFNARRPVLAVSAGSAAPLIEGRPAVVWIEVRNDGLLAAEGVTLELSCGEGHVELLDELGAPVRKLTLEVGALAAGTAVRRSVSAHVRRSTAARAQLKLVASQREFPGTTHETAFAIARQETTIITTAAEPLAERPAAPVAAAPASVAFRRFESGDRVVDDSLLLRFEVQSQSNLETVRLHQNGRVLPLAPPRLLSTTGSRLWQFEQRVDLGYGENDFEVVAVTAEGIRGTRVLRLHRERREGKLWVAVIGISEYADAAIADLRFAREDAAAVLEYYRDRFGLPEEQLIDLFDEEATLMNIKRVFGTDLPAKANNPDDTVILYFAGHGMKEADPATPDSDGFSKYILTHDSDSSDLFASALSMQEMSRILQRFRPERLVLVMDSCFSGAARGGRTLFDGADVARSVVTEEFLTRIADAGKGRVILTASAANELARERSDLGHGVFTYYLLQGLRGQADDDTDGRIDVDEIYKFTSRHVAAATRGQQNPMKKAATMTGTFTIGKTSVRRAH